MPRLNGKFVTQAVYDAAQPAKEIPVSAERNVSPMVLATRELTKSKARLDAAEKKAAKVQSVQDELDAAREAYEVAKAAVSALL